MERKTDVIVIGGGQAGLATSRCLSAKGIDHVVFERGQIGQRWRAERWNTLRLLTPNWMTRLPGYRYQGADPQGFMTKAAVVDMLTNYSATVSAPVLEDTYVWSVRTVGAGFQVTTSQGTWRSRSVVIATGACDRPHVPGFAASLDPSIHQITLDRYKSSAQVPSGGVLVVGASASGCQIAHELQAAGHNVTLAAGGHTRLPRTYRGYDIMTWLDAIGTLKAPRDPGASVEKLMQQHSFQLAGNSIGRNMNLATFQAQGGLVVGRLIGADDQAISLGVDVMRDVAQADARQARILRRIDDFIAKNRMAVPPPDMIAPVQIGNTPTALDLQRAGIRTVVWATGYRRDYSWLDIPVLTAGGEIAQHGGVTGVAGLYTMGLPYMRRCNSTFIDGVGQDARDITRFIATHLGHRMPKAA